MESELFSQENGLLTPSFKLKRLQLVKHYKIVIEKLYNEYSKGDIKIDTRQIDPEVTESLPCTIHITDENKAPEAPIASSIEEETKHLDSVHDHGLVVSND